MNESLEEIKLLISVFNKYNLNDIAIILTGSLARGNPRIENGKLESDIDILLVINDINLINKIKKILLNEFQFKSRISLIFCLKDKIIASRYRGVIKSIETIDNILYDKLDIKNQLISALNSPINITEMNRSLVQEFCYYASKYMVQGGSYLLMKIQKYWENIQELNNMDVQVNCFNLKEIYILLKNNNIQFLDSSEYFFSNFESDKDIYYHVRNLVSLENQGLSFEECIFSLD
ncbi:hypothetical protein CIRMBP1284_02328 [Enterococcus cecorum]|nr:hypothetical protein CIRMBP1284_02328 [Enterococcus cecorum]